MTCRSVFPAYPITEPLTKRSCSACKALIRQSQDPNSPFCSVQEKPWFICEKDWSPVFLGPLIWRCVHSKRVWTCCRVNKMRTTGHGDLNHASCNRFLTVCVLIRTRLAFFTSFALRKRCYRAWMERSQSWSLVLKFPTPGMQYISSCRK
jgi:hypothetical protein